VAHNAAFDRSFFDKRFPELNDKSWACSIKGINLRGLGYEGSKLEYLLLKEGWFYEGHRASIDCLAVAWFFKLREDALKELIESKDKVEFIIRAVGATFSVKDALKQNGYKFDGESKAHGKHWWVSVGSEEEAEAALIFLSELYDGAKSAVVERIDARARFKAS